MITGLLVAVLLLISIFFNTLGIVSLFRFPDVYTRLHGTTKCTTFGTLFVIFGLLVYSFMRFMWTGESRFLVLLVHAVIAGVVLLVTNATGAHALARAAHRKGILPEPALIDALEERNKNKEGVSA